MPKERDTVTVSSAVGARVGRSVGPGLGRFVGLGDGGMVGCSVGAMEGSRVGFGDGWLDEGCEKVGDTVGNSLATFPVTTSANF